MRPDGAILVTGASGLLGRMIAATLLANEDRDLVLPVRKKHDPEDLKAELLAELEVLGAPAERLKRAHFVQLPPIPELHLLSPLFTRHAITEVVHCAGSLSYGNEASLQEGNIDFTRSLIGPAQRAGVSRFTYLSTAFSSGVTSDHAPIRPPICARSGRQSGWWLTAACPMPSFDQPS